MKNKAYLFVFGTVVLLGIILFFGTERNSAVPVEHPTVMTPEGITEITNDSSGWVEMVLLRDNDERIQLARSRGKMMRELIRSNPEQAIREALTLSEWSKLPPEMQAYVEQPFSAIANVEVMIACGEGISETTILTVFPATGEMETFVYGRRNGLGTKNGAPVQGIRMGNIGVLREEIFQPLATADEDAALQLFPVAIADPGGDSVAALGGGKIFYFKSQAALDEANARLAALEELPGPSTGTEALFESFEAYLTDDGEIDFIALEAAAELAAAEWTGTPRDMYVILVDFPDRMGEPTDPVALSNSINTTVSQQIWEMSYEATHIVCTVNPTTYTMPLGNAAYTNNSLLFTHATNAVPGVDLSPYETVCVFHPAIDGETYAGLASVGGSKMWLKSASTRVITHEFGHNYGSRHASAWTNAVSSNPVEPAPAGGKVEYGDFSDIMGSGAVPEGHFNIWHKKHIAWFAASNWSSVTNSGIYRIYRSDHYQTTGLLRGLEIEKGASDYYWVGLRQEYPAYETFSRGAYLLWKKSGDNRSYLLDTSPLSAGGKTDGGLALGQTFSDTADDVHITPTARGGQTPNEWMDITVNLGAFPGNSAPTASISGPSNLTVQASALFTVTASDVDGDELAYFWDTGDGLVKPNTPTIATTWLSGSTVTVSCVVSDMKGGTNKVSQSVVLSSSLENWTQRTSGTTEPLRDIVLGGNRLVAVGGDATTAYSDDGTNWTVHTSFDVWEGNFSLYGVGYDGSQFIATGRDYDGGPVVWEQVIFTSPDGTHWTKRYDSNSGTYPSIHACRDATGGNGVLVAVGDDGAILRSTNGLSWSTISSGIGTGTNLHGVSYGDGIFVVVGAEADGGPAVVLTSSDGLVWTNHSAGVDLSSWKGFYDVKYCNDRFLASGWYARILHSTDKGQTFSTLMSGDRLQISGFAYGNENYFAAGINKDNSNADINLVSTDGANWTALSTASQDNRNAAVFYNGTFITVGDNGSIWQSDPIGAVETGFANWQLENAEELGFDRDPLDDADFDGSLNLTEYALGTTATDAGSVPSSAMVSTGSYFQVSYGRDGVKSDVDYEVERSVNLISNDWSTANTVTLEDSVTNLAVRSALTIASQTNEFMRLNLKLINP